MNSRIRWSRAIVIAAAMGTFGFVAAVRAGDCGVAGNLVPNCGFDVDLANWTLNGEPALHVAGDGASAPGCAALDRYESLQMIEAVSDCLGVEPLQPYALAMSVRLASGAVPDICFLSLLEYSDASCGAFLFEDFFLVHFDPTWRELRRGRTVGASTQSAYLKLTCSGPSDFVVRIDDGVVVPVVFADGFETFDTSFWSLAVP